MQTYLLESILVELSHKRRKVAMTEMLNQDILLEVVLVLDDEAIPRRTPIQKLAAFP